MEILSRVLEGTVEHQDSMGNRTQIKPGEVQRMTAGTGVRHSECNPSASESAHFLQIWIEPSKQGLVPGYEQKRFPEAELCNTLRLVCSPDGREGSVTVHQDAFLYRTLLEVGESVRYPLAAGRRAYVHVAKGAVRLNGHGLTAGGGARVEAEAELHLGALDPADVLLFDLP